MATKPNVMVDKQTRRGKMKCELGKPSVIIEERKGETLNSERAPRENATNPNSLKSDSGGVVMRQPAEPVDRSGGFGKSIYK